MTAWNHSSSRPSNIAESRLGGLPTSCADNNAVTSLAWILSSSYFQARHWMLRLCRELVTALL